MATLVLVTVAIRTQFIRVFFSAEVWTLLRGGHMDKPASFVPITAQVQDETVTGLGSAVV